MEWLYHSLCATPPQQIEMALNGWLMALDTSQKYAQEWAKVMMMAGTSTGFKDVEHWSQLLQNGLQGLEENRWAEMVEVLSALLQETFLEDKCRAIALVAQAMFPLYYLLSQDGNSQIKWETKEVLDLNQIIEALTQAVSLAPDREYFACRGIVHLLKGNIDEAKSDLNRTLQLDKVDNKLKEQIEWLLNGDFQEIELKNEELQRLNEEFQRLNEELQKAQEKAARKSELAQKLRRLMEETQEQGEEFQNLTEEAPTIKEECQRLTEFLQRRKEEIQKLEEAIQRKKEQPQGRKEEIQKLEEELLRKKRDLQKVAGGASKLLGEFQEKEQRI